MGTRVKLVGGVCRFCLPTEYCDDGTCRPLDQDLDCPTCPDCDCETTGCPNCHICNNDGQCEYSCIDGEICCLDLTRDDDTYLCYHGDCCNNADCEEGYICKDNDCTVAIADSMICGGWTAEKINSYVRHCRDEDCDLFSRYAFSFLNLYGLDSLNVSTSTVTGEALASQTYCCQEGRNCADGYNGCQPHCEVCCDVDDCSTSFIVTAVGFTFRVDNILVSAYLYIPAEYLSGDNYKIYDNSIDLTKNETTTCSYFRYKRNDAYELAQASCQKQEGKSDYAFPCTIRIYSTGTSEPFE